MIVTMEKKIDFVRRCNKRLSTAFGILTVGSLEVCSVVVNVSLKECVKSFQKLE